MKQLIKRLFYRVHPRLATSFFSERARAHSHRVIESWGCRPINEMLIARFGERVVGGPFRGLTLSPMTRSEQLGPYLLGVYERELEPAWGCLLSGSFSQIVDVGAKFGYYAVGLAREFPDSRVVAFDTDRWARAALGEMTRANGTPNVEIKGYCDPSWLASNLADGALIVSDCEGFEADLLCSIPIPNLDSATLLIELHEAMAPGVTGRLLARLGPTHRLSEIRTDPGDAAPPGGFDLDGLDEGQRSLALREVRPSQSWLLGLPRVGPNRSLRGPRDPAA